MKKHFLLACPQFKALPHHQRMSTIKSNDLSVNCFHPGHFVKQCQSSGRCRKRQKSNHTQLHVDPVAQTPAPLAPAMNLTANISPGTKNSLLMTCRVLVRGPWQCLNRFPSTAQLWIIHFVCVRVFSSDIAPTLISSCCHHSRHCRNSS